MSAAPDYDFTWPGCPPSSLAGLLNAASAAVGQLADGADLDHMADRDAAAVMGALTTLVGRLDGLRVQVARAVRDRQICGLRGTRNLAGWLRADARLADDSWKIGRLAAAGPDLPRITALLGEGTISLAQAATACWQIAQLPAVPVPPAVINPAEPSGTPEPCHAPGPGSTAGSGSPIDQPSAPDDRTTGSGSPASQANASDNRTTGSGSPASQANASDNGTPGPDDGTADLVTDTPGPDDVAPGPDDGTASPDDGTAGPDTGQTADDTEPPGCGQPAAPVPTELPAGVDPSGGEGWAGLWRAGDVRAAADQLFAAFLPGLDGGQLRQLGAHLREAADTQDRAAGDYGDYARRGLRISRSLHGTGEITGRLHAEAAEQVIAAFDQLGRKTGPDDTRTKAQRWADALTRLTAITPDLPAGPAAPDAPEPTTPDTPEPTTPDTPEPTTPDTPEPTPDAPEPTTPDAPGPTGPAGSAEPAADPASPGNDQPGPADRYTEHDHASQDRHAQAVQGGGAGDARRDSGPPADAPSMPVVPVPAGLQRPRVIVTVPLDTLLGRPLAPGATLGPGTPLTAEAARRLACDADIIRLITARHPLPGHDHCEGNGHDLDGDLITSPGDATAQLTARMGAAIAGLPPPLAGPSAVLDIGRQSPGWTPRQRDALHTQYGGHCGFGRCGGPIDVIHHIIHWLHGGKTRIRNGFPCCLYHHWLIHEGGWRIMKHPDGTITTIPPPPGWKPGAIYRKGKLIHEHPAAPSAS